jgi:hypothetical protein
MSKALMFGPALFLLLEGWRVSSAACNSASFRTAGKVDPTPHAIVYAVDGPGVSLG